jgi:hypothetical protein
LGGIPVKRCFFREFARTIYRSQEKKVSAQYFCTEYRENLTMSVSKAQFRYLVGRSTLLLCGRPQHKECGKVR